MGRELPAGLVVFLVALPLCLGIALASHAPLFAGLITGIVGGTVVAFASGSSTSVSGPAAGLTVLVAHAIAQAGSFRAFLTALCVAGVMQFALGVARAGVFGSFIPSTVIRGLLAAIGAILVLKQIPHAVGFVGDFDGDMEFAQADGRNTFSEIPFALGHLHAGATIIALCALGAMLALERLPKERRPRWMPGPLLAVLVGLALNELFVRFVPALAVPARLRVALPALDSAMALRAQLVFPDPSALLRAQTWSNAATIAIVASIETLLCIEAVDKLDPLRRTTPPNRELQAQGLGNLIAGLLGGIPMTAVVVRGSANVQAGGRTRWSAVFHGALLLIATAALWPALNRVPLSALAAVLLLIGYRLTPVGLFPQLWRKGWAYSAPFFATFAGIVVTDLLKGVAIGMLVAVFIVLQRNVQRAIEVRRDGERATLSLDGHVSFLHKSLAMRRFEEVGSAREITVDGSSATHIDPDVIEVIHDLAVRAEQRGVTVVLKAIPDPIGLSAH
ncbi:MAG: SulP family inorganic anion transporter [Polyangiales bacterium]